MNKVDFQKFNEVVINKTVKPIFHTENLNSFQFGKLTLHRCERTGSLLVTNTTDWESRQLFSCADRVSKRIPNYLFQIVQDDYLNQEELNDLEEALRYRGYC